MILRYSRLTSLFFIVVSLAVGIPLTNALVTNTAAIEAPWRWIAWCIVAMCFFALMRGVQLLAAPPIVLELTPEGLHLHYKASNGGFSKDSDLLPWRLIEGAKLSKLPAGGRRYVWTVELSLSSPPDFDIRKRNGVRRTYRAPEDSARFYILTTGMFEISKEALLSAIVAGRNQHRGAGKVA